jgi:hypothetical protein
MPKIADDSSTCSLSEVAQKSVYVVLFELDDELRQKVKARKSQAFSQRNKRTRSGSQVVLADIAAVVATAAAATGGTTDAADNSSTALIGEAIGAVVRDTQAPKHVMLSYNWGHQDTIKRVNTSLKGRGYNVWIDIEKMQGSTIDAMSTAVEDSAVICCAISKAYKDSMNC